MMVSVEKSKAFIITYDDGEEGFQTLTVPHNRFNEDVVFRKWILSIKCLFCDSSSCVHCNFMEDLQN